MPVHDVDHRRTGDPAVRDHGSPRYLSHLHSREVQGDPTPSQRGFRGVSVALNPSDAGRLIGRQEMHQRAIAQAPSQRRSRDHRPKTLPRECSVHGLPKGPQIGPVSWRQPSDLLHPLL